MCGLLLIILGAWGALIPFVGPYFHFGFTPDKTWAYSSGRLYLSILPGLAALLGGLLVLGTRSRSVGVGGGLLAAAGGAWFVIGSGIVADVVRTTSIATGSPIAHSSASISLLTWTFLEELGLFAGIGILIVLFGAISAGRLSMLSAKDAAAATAADGTSGGVGGDSQDYSAPQDRAADSPAPASSGAGATAATETFPANAPYSASSGSASSAGQFPAEVKPFPGDEAEPAQYPAATSQFPAASPSGQVPESAAPASTE